MVFLHGFMVESALAEQTVIKLGWGKSFKKERKAPYGANLTLRGKLGSKGGVALAARQVLLESRVRQPGEEWRALDYLTTDSSGRLSYKAKTVPSTSFRASFAGGPGLDSSRSSASLTVWGKVTLDARPRRLRNFDSVTFSGHVSSAGVELPTDGKTVSIQYLDVFVKRPTWRVFDVGSTSRDGDFKFSHRFTNINRRTKFRFRAFLPAEYGWPFADGYSKRVAITVFA